MSSRFESGTPNYWRESRVLNLGDSYRDTVSMKILAIKILLMVALASIAVCFGLSLYQAYDTTIVNVSRSAMFCVRAAMETYLTEHGRLPEATIIVDGHPQSWRTQIDNAVRMQNKDEMFVLTEPWDSDDNLSLGLRTSPYGGFDLVSRHRNRNVIGKTGYFVVTGDETAFPIVGALGLADIDDGVENTVLVVETAGSPFPWTQPIDIPFAELRSLYDGRHELSLNSHSQGTGLLFADMSRYYLVKMPSFEIFQSLFTTAGREPWTRGQLIDEGFLEPMSPGTIPKSDLRLEPKQMLQEP